MKHKYVLKRKMRFTLLLTIVAVTILSAAYVSTVHGYKESSAATITVMQGDTLWNIARDYNTNGDVREYIYKVKKLNGLDSSIIYPGMQIKLPN